MGGLRPAAVVAAAALLAAACTADAGPPLLLLPRDGGELAAVSDDVLADALGEVAEQLPDVRSATVTDVVPGDADGCTTEDWVDPPQDGPVLAVPGYGFTQVRTASVGDGLSRTLVCDHDADGDLLVVDDLQTTGTDRPVGNDYVARAGTIAGRVDVGIPPSATLAVQVFDDWSLLVPLQADMVVLRLHALEGGSTEDGYDVGEVRFFTADGEDVTTASVPIPDVVHGVPRNRGSSVGD